MLRGSSLIARIMRETEDVDVLAVADPEQGGDESEEPAKTPADSGGGDDTAPSPE